MFDMNHAEANGGRYLLLLGADILLRERAIVSALRTYPGPVIGMSESPATSSANRFFDHVLQASYYDAGEALAAVEEFERETGLRPNAVVPIIEMTVHVSAAIARHYRLPRLSDECVARARDKHTMKIAFEEAMVPCARHRLFSTLPELRAVAAELAFPLVLKPRDFAGNVGTIRVDGTAELPAAFDYCRESLLEVAPTYDFADGRFQAEEFVSATHEVSVEIINYKGRRAVLAVTDKSKAGAPYFTEKGQLVPSVESGNRALRQVAMDACEALRIDRGIAHVEVLVNGPELSVVEVAARPGGDGIMDLIDRVYGFNPYDVHIASYRHTLDRLPDFRAEPRGIGATSFLKAPVGTVAAVHAADKLTNQEVGLYATAHAGDWSRPATSYLARDGVIECFEAGATDTKEFRARVDQLAELRVSQLFTVTPDDAGTVRAAKARPAARYPANGTATDQPGGRADALRVLSAATLFFRGSMTSPQPGPQVGPDPSRLRLPLGHLMPATKASRVLLLVALVDSVGTGLYLTGSVLFFVRTVGLSAVEVGAGMSVAGILGLLTMVPVASFSDRIGVRRTLIALQAWRGVWFALYAVVHSFPAFLVVSCMLGLANQAVPPINQAVVAAANEGPSRVRIMALTRAMRNVGFSLGAVAATGIIALNSTSWFRAIVVADGVSFIATAILLVRVRLLKTPEPARRDIWWRGLHPRNDPWFFPLAGLNGVLALHMTLLAVGLPLWITQHTRAPHWVVGTVVFTNTVLAVVCQVRASRGCDLAPAAARRARAAGLVLAVCCLLAAASGRLPGTLAAVGLLATAVTLTMGELWQSSSAWGLSYALAPAERQAAYISAFNLGLAAQTIVGPVLVTLLVVNHGWAGWTGLAVAFALTGAFIPAIVTRCLGDRAAMADRYYRALNINHTA